jgi:2-dehydropantoate 2-reductase
MWNIPFSGLTTLLQADTKRLLACPATERLARDLLREVMRGARACGATVPAGFDEKMMEDTRRMIPYEPSMSIDRRKKRPMEVEAMFGEPWRTAKAAGEDLARIGTFYRQLSFLNDIVVRARKASSHD